MSAVRSERADVVVLGLGGGGEHLARRLADGGLDVVAVERDLVGGECPFWGCTPSKLLLHAARAGHGWPRAADRIRSATHDWTDDQHAGPLERAGVRVVRGHGRLAGPGTVEVEGADGRTSYAARLGVVLDTGTRPAVPDIPGLEGTPFWTNRDLVRLPTAPRSVVVLGGGPIGCEMAQGLARLGADVTLLEVADRVLGPEEPEAAEVVARTLRRAGVAVRVGVEIASVAHDGRFGIETDGGTVTGDHLLVATGRTLNIDDLGLASVGLDADVDHLVTDERMRAGDRLWAVGDITGRGAFTHVAHYQARIAARDLLGEDGPWADYRAVPRVTFTDPEVGAVGRTEEQARAEGLRVGVGTADLGDSSRGWIDETDGVVKVVADLDRGVLVGGTVVAPYGGEVVGLIAAAVHGEIPIERLRELPAPFPTFQLAVATALDEL